MTSFQFQRLSPSQIHSYYKLGKLSISAALSHLSLDPTTAQPTEPLLYSRLLRALPAPSSHPSFGLLLHCHVIKSGLLACPLVANSLLPFYLRLYPLRPTIARHLFDELRPVCDVVSWTSLVSGYLRASQPEEGLKLFAVMPLWGIVPNEFTLSAAVKACSALVDPRVGGSVHAVVLTRGFSGNFVVSSALIDMYGRCALVSDAQKSRFPLALDGCTFASVITSLGNLGRLKQGRELHAVAIVSGTCCGNIIVESSIVDMYAKCRAMDDSRRTFDRMSVKNAVSWCSLLSGYCHLGFYSTVLSLFSGMSEDAVDVYTLSTVLRACAGLAAAKAGKEVHSRIIRTTRGLHHFEVESALVDLYAKCGLIAYASRVFVRTPVRNTITWNSMICGFAQNGMGGEAIKLFRTMTKEGIAPDHITFIGVLSACSHTGMAKLGKEFFKLMERKYHILPCLEHYNCMVDLLGRHGLLKEAENLINGSGFRDNAALWGTLLGACMTHLDLEIAEHAAKKIIVLDPDYHHSYVLLANIYKKVDRWKEALEIRKVMWDRSIKKTAGTSLVEAQ
ncbi:Pentatricopeptide repeat-containing protein [Rhynchospora pubera]|uniref:Pentatricopeptide repeat-containing protein n=1 Tax=Rhynchospora pubera TaxID=906938 RepID=A0AAV8G0U2_9POAL|nr:Pentatricopeptide repeat-containing protein [Rhynchospora pubera]